MGKTIYTQEHRRLVAILRQLREEAGMRQVDLAERLGRPQSFVSKYESGDRRLDLVELQAISQELGLTLIQFVQRFEGRTRPAAGRGLPTRHPTEDSA